MNIKYICICMLFLYATISLFAQPYPIYNSTTYCELIFKENDTTLQITGHGEIPEKAFFSIANTYNTSWAKLAPSIQAIKIDEGITLIGKESFKNCSTKVVTLPRSIEFIEEEAFSGCKNLSTIKFSINIESIMAHAFSSCGFEDTLILPDRLSFLGAFSFSNNHKLKSLILSLNIDSIEVGCFSNCNSLSNLFIPATFTNFGTEMFSWCTNLSEIVNLSLVPQEINENVFEKVNKSACYLKVPNSALMAYKMAPVWQDFLLIGGGLSISATPDDFNNGSVTGLEPKFYNNGDNITIKAVPNNGYKFEAWTANGNIISTQNPFSFTATKDTAIVATFSKGNSLKDENLKNLIAIFPNPVNDMLFINTELEITEIAIYDVLGRKLFQKHHAKEININNLNSGIYFLKINTELGSYTKKILKK